VFVIILAAALATPAGEGRVTGKLYTGAPVEVAEDAVGPEGGTLVVESGQLEGMTISVPAGAYEGQTGFTVSESPIKSQTFGALFQPITPLISVDNGEVFAAEPLEVTVPISLEEGQFAMGFYYDEETGTLEGIPLVDETDTSITLATKHFSDIFIAMAEVGDILGRALTGIDTGFRPGEDDFITSNMGSYPVPGGYCVGQCIAEQYYYMMKDRGGPWSGQLYGRFDNNGLGDTPGLKEDDANVVRLCTVMQTAYIQNFYTSPDLSEYRDFRSRGSDEQMFLTLAYAMLGTGQPQMFDCRLKNDSGGHMVLAYKIENDLIWVADPNFPADTSEKRTIQYDRTAAGGPALTPYYSAANAQEAQKAGVVPYENFVYYGTYALVDQLAAHAAWQNFFDGKVPGAGLFPDDLKLYAFTGLKETDTGETEKDLVPLTDGLTLQESRLQETAAAGGKLFFKVEYPAGLKAAGFNVYIGDKQQTTEKIPSMEGFYGIQLQPGENDIGIYFAGVNPKKTDKGYQFINFYRFKVIYDGTGATTGPEPTPAYTEEPWPTYTEEPWPDYSEEPTPEYSDEPTPAPPEEDTYDYAAALAAYTADYAAQIENDVEDDGESRTVTEFEWIVVPFIQDGQVYGAHRTRSITTYYAGPKAGTTYESTGQMYDEANPDIYISVYALKEMYPQFGN